MSFSMSSSYLSISSATAVRAPAKDSDDWDAAYSLWWYPSGGIPGLLRNGQGAGCGLDRVGKPEDLRGLGIRRHTSPANHRIPHLLDVLRRKKFRRMQGLGLQRHGVPAEPGGQFLLPEGAVGEVEEGKVDVLLRSLDIPAVSVQKRERNDQRGAFVSINKRVISGDSAGVGRSYPEDIRLIGVGK